MKHYFYTKDKRGRNITCNKCGLVIFSKRVMEHSISGNSYNPEAYEPLPEGWKLGNEEDLCPNCSAICSEN